MTIKNPMWLMIPNMILGFVVGGLVYETKKQGKLIDAILCSRDM